MAWIEMKKLFYFILETTYMSYFPLCCNQEQAKIINSHKLDVHHMKTRSNEEYMHKTMKGSNAHT